MGLRLGVSDGTEVGVTAVDELCPVHDCSDEIGERT